jgi:hypothetical protein
MIRSDELIKASSSAAMVETLDTKLQAFVRKKAVQMENAEKRAFDIYHDWTGENNTVEISYNRQYNNRAMEHELKELNMLMDLNDRLNGSTEALPDLQEYDTQDEAEAVAIAMGGSGSHEHTADNGSVKYMPFTTHDEYTELMGASAPETDLRDKLRDRLEQLMTQSSTSNSL